MSSLVDFTRACALVAETTYTELLYLTVFAPAGTLIFQESDIYAMYKACMLKKAESLTPEEIVSIKKEVCRIGEEGLEKLSKSAKELLNFKPSPAEGDTKQTPKKMKDSNAKAALTEKKKAAKKGATDATNIENSLAEVSKASCLPAQETDVQLWERYFALSATLAEAKEAQDKIKDRLFERATELGLFAEGSQTGVFPCGLGKIRLAHTVKLKVPKYIPDEFFEEHDELFELTPDNKRILEILQSDDEDAILCLHQAGFEKQVYESRTFLKQ